MKEKWNIKSSHSSKSTSQRGEELDGEPPIDKLKIVYSIVLLHGIVVLLPWNMFITIAPNYYVNYWFTVDGNKTSYAKSFMSALGITAQIPNFSMSLISVMQIIGGSLMFRIAGPLALNCLNVAVILALVIFQDPNVDAMQWFYIVSLAIAMLMNASNGLYQNSIYGLAADFPPAYTNALMVGNNVCGTFISILSIVETICFPHNYKTVAIIYFSISLAVLVLCEILLLLLTRLLTTTFSLKDFYKYYVLKGQKSRLDQRTTRPSLSQFLEAFKMCWMQLLSVFLVFFVSLAVFPTVLVGTVPNKKGEPWNSAISRDLYPGVTTFLNFNLMAAIGSTLASFIQFPGPDKLLVVAMARLLFIPYFMLCNYNVDDRVMPVFFENEWFFIIGNTIMAFTSGYYSSLGMMYAPKVVPDSLSKTAGMAAALCIVTGVMVGVAFTPVIATMVNNIG
ncbi:nucleoside transporter [Dictyocaulus viviparus]|uniref:Nucleoside transporter n=1 Tax=Dictyocaulus viviparus TaxID=29172 RepID=A0A0D8XVF9_DICVI|nr:nucleoside transporter [Dictyocaulus viviparus]